MNSLKHGNNKSLFEGLATPSHLLPTSFDLSRSVEENDSVLDSWMYLRIQPLEPVHKNCGVNDTKWKREHDDIKLEIVKEMLRSYSMEADAMREERDNALKLVESHRTEIDAMRKERDNALKLLEAHCTEVDAMREERDNALKRLESMRKERDDANKLVEIPPAFLCPITLEVMQEPCFAADGFTYEAKAIKEWFARGHNTSPMTNLKLSHKKLEPNLLLRSAIQSLKFVTNVP